MRFLDSWSWNSVMTGHGKSTFPRLLALPLCASSGKRIKCAQKASRINCKANGKARQRLKGWPLVWPNSWETASVSLPLNPCS